MNNQKWVVVVEQHTRSANVGRVVAQWTIGPYTSRATADEDSLKWMQGDFISWVESLTPIADYERLHNGRNSLS